MKRLLTLKEVLELPIKEVSEDQMKSVLDNSEYNGNHLYYPGIGDGLEGNDFEFRYRMI